MGINLERIAEDLRSGRYSDAAEYVARLRQENGKSPEWALAVAVRARKLREPRMMRLALALWPEALGVDFERFLASMNAAQAQACLELSPELREVAKRRAATQADAWVREEKESRARSAESQRTLSQELWEELQSQTWAGPKVLGVQADPAAVKARREAMVRAAPKVGSTGPTIKHGRIKPRWDLKALRLRN